MRGITHLRRQALRRHERRAPDGVRRAHRQDRLGHHHRRSLQGQLQHQQRSARRQGQSDPGPRRLPDLSRREMLHQRLRCRTPASRSGGSTRSPRRASPAATRWGTLPEPVPRRRRVVDHRQLRSGAESHVLGHGAGQALDADQPRHVGQRRRAVHELDAGARRRHRQARLVLPARARRIARPRHRLRARCSSTTTTRTCCSRSARTASSGSSIARPASISATRKRCSRTSGNRSIRRPAGRRTAPTSSSSSSASGCRDARAPRAATTGRRPAITRPRTS